MSQDKKGPLTSFQIRAARALVKWSAEDLARNSSVSLRTIRRAELAERHTSMTAPNDLAIRHAFEGADVEFTADALLEIAKMAKAKDTGARGLRSIVEELSLIHI